MSIRVFKLYQVDGKVSNRVSKFVGKPLGGQLPEQTYYSKLNLSGDNFGELWFPFSTPIGGQFFLEILNTTTGSPVNFDEIDVKFAPAMLDVNGDPIVGQAGFSDLKSDGTKHNFTTSKNFCAHLNHWVGSYGSYEKSFGPHGFLIYLDDHGGGTLTGTLDIYVIVR